MAQRSNINRVGLLRMNDDSARIVRFRKTHVGPGSAAVSRLINPITPIRNARIRIAVVRFSRPRPNDIRVRRRHRHRTKRHRIFVVKNRLERMPVISGLPQAARRRCCIKRIRLVPRDRKINRPASLPRWPDRPIVKRPHQFIQTRLCNNVEPDTRPKHGGHYRNRGDSISEHIHHFRFLLTRVSQADGELQH